jgi:hypothetical protein
VSFYRKKQGRFKIKSTGTVGKVPMMVNGETVASQWLRAEQSCRGSDSSVELNDTRSKQTMSPMAVFGW